PRAPRRSLIGQRMLIPFKRLGALGYLAPLASLTVGDALTAMTRQHFQKNFAFLAYLNQLQACD
ncbi:MAG: hypothetical protein WBZ29_12745, partial [Methanocella sp.]